MIGPFTVALFSILPLRALNLSFLCFSYGFIGSRMTSDGFHLKCASNVFNYFFKCKPSELPQNPSEVIRGSHMRNTKITNLRPLVAKSRKVLQ